MAGSNIPVILKAKNLVEKRNILNEMRNSYMTLQEARFLAIYLSRINPRDLGTRVVTFPLNDFIALLEIQKVNIDSIKATTDRLLCKVVNVPDDNGGYIAFQLFKECRVFKDRRDEWYMEIDAHDRALPLMFDFKERYIKYKVENILKLCSSNQIRIYEILKQYENIGMKTFALNELRELIGIENDKHTRFNNFKMEVLEKSKKTLKECTDISFEYELIRKGKGGKVTEIRFIISENKEQKEHTSIEEYIKGVQSRNTKNAAGLYKNANENKGSEENNDYFQLFSEALSNEFPIDKVKLLYHMSLPIVKFQKGDSGFQTDMYDYLLLKYRELNTKKNVKLRFNYLKKLITIDLDERKVTQ